MKVITEYPVYIDSNLVGGTDWLNFDSNGKPTTKEETKRFQDWLDANKPGWAAGYTGGVLKGGSGYGKYPFGPSTQNAWVSYGAEFAKSIGQVVTSSQTVTPTSTGAATPTATQQAEAKKKGFNWDKAKGVWVKAGELGITDKLLGLFGIAPKPDSTLPDVSTGGTEVAPTEKKGMSKTTKLVIVGGGILVLGLIIFAATRPKK